MKRPLIGLLILALIPLAACNKRDKRVAFDGVYFKTKAKRIDDDWSEFTVSVTPATASLDGAREAARYEATRYCVQTDGTSRIIWTVGPDADPAQLRIEKDTIVFQGRCNP